jgi:beta-mannosidase
MEFDFTDYLNSGLTKKQVGVEYRLIDKNIVVSRGTNLFVKPKYYEFKVPEYRITVTEEGEYFMLHIATEVYTSYVELYLEEEDVIFEDNYFDITSKEGVTVALNKQEFNQIPSVEKLIEMLHIRSVADSF